MITSTEMDAVQELLYGFYDGINDIHDYYRKLKAKKLDRTFNEYIIRDMFSDWTMMPEDMEFDLVEVEHKALHDCVELVSAFPQELQVGCKLSICVVERKTGKTVGYIRMSSPVLSLSCRNKIFGQNLDGKQVNRYIMNGAIFVPVQPFGYNCAGGKLLAMIGCSHEVRKMYNDKFNTNVIYMETMALYGSLRPTSQYDGLEPIIRSGGLTESQLPLYPDTQTYTQIYWILSKHFDDLDRAGGLSGKSIQFKKMLGIIHKIRPMDDLIVKIYGMNTQKRYYYSTCGHKNVVEGVTTDNKIIRSDNYDAYYLYNLIKRWKRIAQRRHDNLESMNNLKTKLEYSAPRELQRGF